MGIFVEGFTSQKELAVPLKGAPPQYKNCVEQNWIQKVANLKKLGNFPPFFLKWNAPGTTPCNRWHISCVAGQKTISKTPLIQVVETSEKYIKVFPKIVATPQIIHSSMGVFHYFHHPCWGPTPIFGNSSFRIANCGCGPLL